MARARSTEGRPVPLPDSGHGLHSDPRSSRRHADPTRPKVEASAARLSKALAEVPRHLFFPAGVDRLTPNDQAVPLGRGRMMPPVNVVVMMLRALELDGTERVLEIGAGSGYQAALLGRLAREVVSVEADDELVGHARALLDELGSPNIRLIHAEAYGGYPEAAPYQAIVVGAAVSEVPSALLDQLDLGGRLVIPLGDAEAQLIEKFRKRVDGLDSQTIGPCRLHMLATPRKTQSFFPWTRHHRP